MRLTGIAAVTALTLGLTAPAFAQESQACKALGPACDAAIAAEADSQAKSALLYRRAYQKIEKSDLFGARDDLDLALGLNPANARALAERAYALNALGEYALAEADLESKARLEPRNAAFHQERAFARSFQGKLAGALEDREKVVEFLPEDAMARITRADAYLWVGRFAEARRDADAARELAQKAGDDRMIKRIDLTLGEIALWSATSGGEAAKACKAAGARNAFDARNLIGDCSAAFLTATDNATRAEMLTLRSMAWAVGQQDQLNATHDLQIASALDPGNADIHANLGFAYVRDKHSWAGEREFDKALAIKQGWAALAGRASARLNQRNVAGAREDALASVQMRPNEVAFIVLGDIAKDHTGDNAAAIQYWLNAYRLGSRDDGLIARLKSVGITDPSKEAQ